MRMKIFFALTIIASIFSTTNANGDTSDWCRNCEKKIYESNSYFSYNLYNQINRTSNKSFLGDNDKSKTNSFFSPYSIFSAISIAFSGSEGETRDEIQNVLHGESEEVILAGSKSITNYFANLSQVPFRSIATENERTGCSLVVSNDIFVQKDFSIKEDFCEKAQESFNAQVTEVDFGNAQETAQQINNHIKAKTDEKIKTIIAPSDINNLTKLILANAIHFKGFWEKPFNPIYTKVNTFKRYPTSDKTINVKMMEQTNYFNYIKRHHLPRKTSDSDASSKESPSVNAPHSVVEILELPYKNSSVSMFIILPDKTTHASSNFNPLNIENMTTILENWETESKLKEVTVKIPQFRLESSYNLKNHLSEMGMPSAFCSLSADFSGITESDSLHISKIIHKAVVEVNEAGSEAAAATAIVMNARSIWTRDQASKIIFNANHPFAFVVVDKATNIILFVGNVTTPKEHAAEENEFSFEKLQSYNNISNETNPAARPHFADFLGDEDIDFSLFC